MNIADFVTRLEGVRRTRRGFIACCPAHDDRSPSLSLKESASGDVLLYCFAGCEFGDIIAALGLQARDCFVKGVGSTSHYRSQHRAHEVDSEVSGLMRRYGFSVETAKALVRVHLKRASGGLA